MLSRPYVMTACDVHRDPLGPLQALGRVHPKRASLTSVRMRHLSPCSRAADRDVSRVPLSCPCGLALVLLRRTLGPPVPYCQAPGFPGSSCQQALCSSVVSSPPITPTSEVSDQRHAIQRALSQTYCGRHTQLLGCFPAVPWWRHREPSSLLAALSSIAGQSCRDSGCSTPD